MARFVGSSTFSKGRIDRIRNTLDGLDGYIAPVGITLNIKVTDESKIEDLLNKLASVMVNDLVLLATAAVEEIQALVVIRMMRTHQPGDFMTYAGTPGGTSQPALDQRSELIPLISAPPAVLAQTAKTVSLAAVNTDLLSQVKINEVVTGEDNEFPSTLLGKDERGDDDPFPDQVFDTRQADVQQLQLATFGRTKKIRATKSPFLLTWQILEFGTGIFAHHPEYGWGPRETDYDLEHPTKVPGGRGAWYLNPSIAEQAPDKGIQTEIMGQAGGHFLFGYKNDPGMIINEYNVAVQAITRKFNELLGLGGARRRPQV